MKVIVFCFATAVAVSSAIKQEIFSISEEKMQDVLNNYGKPCAEEFNVDPKLLMKIPYGTLPKDEATNKFLYCFVVKGGFANEEGEVSADRFAGIVGDHPLREELMKAIRKCNEIKGEDPVSTIALRAPCVALEGPLHFKIHQF